MWDRVEVGAGGQADETTSLSLERDSSAALFRVETRATVHAAKTASKLPSCVAAASARNVCTAFDNHVHVFDASCANVLASLELDSQAEHVAWGGDTAFLVIADSAGTIHFVDAVTNTVLFSQELIKRGPTEAGPAFASLGFEQHLDGEAYSFAVLTVTGKLFFFSNIDLDNLRRGMDGGNMSLVQEVRSAIRMQQRSLSNGASSSHFGGALVVDMGWTRRIVAWHEKGLDVWVDGDIVAAGAGGGVVLEDAVEFPGGVLQCAHVALSHGHYLIVLDGQHTLRLMLLDALITLRTSPLEIEAFFPLSATDSDAQPRIVCLSGAATKTAPKRVIVLRADTFAEEYNLQVSQQTTLASCGDPENIYLIEMRAGEDAPASVLLDATQPAAAVALVRTLEPTRPTNRFYHLLHRKRFEEAQALAREYGLDEKLVHEVRVNSVLDEADSATHAELLPMLLQSLDHVEDLDFVINAALNASLPDVATTLEALSYAERRLEAAPPPSAAEADASAEREELRSQVLCAVKRLGTFHLAGGDAAFDPAAWHRFRQADLLAELTNCMAAARVGTASVIWTRHLTEYELTKHIPRALQAIPDLAPTRHFLPWLCTSVFPAVLGQDHASVLDWVARRVQRMELTERVAWPGCALDMLDAVAPLVARYGVSSAGSGSSTSTNSSLSTAAAPLSFTTGLPRECADRLCGHDCSDDNSNVSAAPNALTRGAAAAAAAELASLRRQLEDVAYLASNVGFSLTLAEYARETPATIVLRLLDRVAAAELLPEVVESEAAPYAARHGLALDETLVRYVTHLAVEHGRGAAGPSAAHARTSAWSSRAVAVITCLGSVEAKAEAALAVMRAVTVPYTDEVEGLIGEALAWPHRREREFREQHRILQLQKMLQPYGIAGFNVSNPALARGLVRRIAADLERPSAVADALQVVHAYPHLSEAEVYEHRVRNLALAGRVREGTRLFASLPPVLLETVGLRLVQWSTEVLDTLDANALGFGAACHQGARVAAGPDGKKSGRDGDARPGVDGDYEDDEDEDDEEEQDAHSRGGASAAATRTAPARGRQQAATVAAASAAAADARASAGRILALAPQLLDVMLKVARAHSGSLGSLGKEELGELGVTCAKFRQLEALAAEFDLLLRPSELATALGRASGLERLLRRELEETEQATSTASSSTAAAVSGAAVETRRRLRHVLRRAGALLSLNAADRLTALAALVGQSWGAPLVPLLVDAAAEAPAETPSVAAALATACEVLIKYEAARLGGGSGAPGPLATAQPLLQDVHGLLCRAVALAPAAALCDYTTLCRAAELAADALRQCDTGIAKERAEHVSRLLAAEHFTEAGLVLDTAAVLPNVCRYLTAVYPSTTWRRHMYQQRRVCGRSAAQGEHALLQKVTTTAPRLFQLFSLNQQMELGLRYAVDALATCAQHHYLNAAVVPIAERYRALAPQASGVVTELLTKLLSATLAASRPDRALAMGYMAVLPLQVSFDVFRAGIASTKRQYGKLCDLAHVGVGFSLLWSEAQFLGECATLAKNASWWHRLSSLGVPFDRKQFEANSRAYVSKLLPVVLAASQYDLTLVLEFATAHDLVSADVYLEYVRALCKNNEPGLLSTAAGGRACLPPHLQSKVAQVASLVPDAAGLRQMLLTDCLPGINPYAYERLELVLQLAEAADERVAAAAAVAAGGEVRCAGASATKPAGSSPSASTRMLRTGALLLGVLRMYERTASPSAAELEFIESQLNQPPVSAEAASKEKRLPAHHLLLGDPWAVLKPELTAATVNRLLPVAKLLGLSVDEFYITAVEHQLADPSALLAEGDSAFADVLRLVRRIENTELAVSQAKIVADELPVSRQKTEALDLALELAKRWDRTADKSAKGKVALLVQKLPALYNRVRTQQLLQEAGAADSRTSALLADPKALVSHLYEQYSIGRSAKLLQDRGADLYKLACDIGKLHDVDAEGIRQFLVQTWLLDTDGDTAATDAPRAPAGQRGSARPAAGGLSLGGLLDEGSDGSGSDDDDEISFGTKAVVAGGSKERAAATRTEGTDPLMERAVALLRMGEHAETITYLFNFAYTEDSLKITARARVRAFTALFTVASPALVCRVANKSLEELREHFICLLYATKLQELGQQTTPEQFSKCNKGALVRSLWKNLGHDTRAMILMAELGLDYEIYDAALWQNLLKQMAAHGLTAELGRILVAAAGVPELWCLPNLEQAWAKVIDVSAQRACTGGAHCGLAAEQAILLALQSPFALRGSTSVLQDAARATGRDCLSMAVSLTHPDGLARCSSLAMTMDVDRLFAAMDDAVRSGLPLAGKIQMAVFDALDALGAYEGLLGRPCVDEFVKHLISRDRIDGLLMRTVEVGRLADAAQIVRSHALFHPSSETAPLVLAADDDVLAIAEYARSAGLERLLSLLPESALLAASETDDAAPEEAELSFT